MRTSHSRIRFRKSRTTKRKADKDFGKEEKYRERRRREKRKRGFFGNKAKEKRMPEKRGKKTTKEWEI